jgi:RNA polymerase sigma-70 factor (ECF subfamily)
VRIAQEQIVERYGKVVHRYLLGALRDADAAEELSQEFALRFVRGDLKGADRQRGRFRDYLKGVLFHLIGDYYRRKKRDPQPLPEHHEPAEQAADAALSDSDFLASWRSELLSRGWAALKEHERKTGQPYHSVLRARAEKADLRSTQLAIELSTLLNKSVSSDWVRQTLHRAREKLAEILIEEVTQTLENPTLHDLEQELIDTDLHQYCRPALDRMRGAW